MTRRAFFLFLIIAGIAPESARAQVRASLGVGVGTVRFPNDSGGGTSFSSASFSPALEYASPTLTADVSGSFASLPDAVWSSQGRGSFWIASPPLVHGWRVGTEGVVSGTSRSDGGATAAAHGVAELLRSQARWSIGLGAGPSSGWIGDEQPVTALHLRARASFHRGVGAWLSDWQLSVEPTHFLGAWFTDASAGVTLERRRVVASIWAAARISDTYGSKGAGSALLQFFLSPSVALQAGGGSYLPDPYQGLPRAGFVTFGVRLYGRPRPAAVRQPVWSPLIPEPRGDSLVVRFRFGNVRSVALAGDWNEWRPVPLRSLGGDLWEGALVLPRGLHHFNLLVNGHDWVVPNGVAAVSDGLGGIVGVLLVP